MVEASQQIACPLCGQLNEKDANTCTACQAHLRQATAMVALARRLDRLEKSIDLLRAQLPAPGRPQPLVPAGSEPVSPEPAQAPGVPTPHSEPRPVAPLPSTVDEAVPEVPVQATAPAAAPLPADLPRRAAAQPAGPQAPAPAGFTFPDAWRTGEFWLNKVGIGLVLLSVAFLFRFAIDQGWLTPAVRVGIGLAVASLLAGLGLRLRRRRPHFAQVLLGGGIAAYYISGFAAFQLYDLVPHPVAFLFMSLVTATTFALAVRQDAITLALLASIGGLSTPFLLSTGDTSNLAGLIGYTCLILALATALFFFRGKRLLHWVSNGAGWLILLGTYAIILDGSDTPLNRAAQVGGVLFAAVSTWAIPVLRQVLVRRRPDRWQPARLGIGDAWLASVQQLLSVDVFLFTLFVPVLAYALIGDLLSFTDLLWGGAALALASLFWLLGWGLARLQMQRGLDVTHVIGGVVFLCIAFPFLLDDNLLFLAYVVTAVALQAVGLSAKRQSLEAVAHLLAAAVATWLLGRLAVFPFLESSSQRALLNATALTDFTALALLAGASFMPAFRGGRLYRTAAAVLLGAWFWRELDGSVLLVVLTVEMVALHGLVRWREELMYRPVADSFALLLGGWVLARLADRGQGIALINPSALSDLLLIGGLLGLGWLYRGRLGAVYLVAGYAGLLAWFWRELDTLSNGQALITTVWGALGVALLVVALRRDMGRLRLVGLGTLGLVVVKLLLVDLAAVNPFLRVLLFFGVGGAFLLLSFFYQVLARQQPADP